MVQFSGHYDGKVITPDETVEIPVNIPLRVTIEPAREQELGHVDWKRLLDLAKECSIEGPEDLAERHDFYAHGEARGMKVQFADTYYLLALVNRKDKDHDAALRHSQGRELGLVTTSWILVEFADALAAANCRISAMVLNRLHFVFVDGRTWYHGCTDS